MPEHITGNKREPNLEMDPMVNATPTAEALLRLLDSEIEYARAEEQRGGWNNWALGGALVAIVGLAGSLWQSNALAYEVVVTWVLALASILDPMATRIWAWARHVQPRMPGKRYQFFSDLEDRRLAYGWWAVRALLLAVAAASIWGNGVWKPALVWTIINYVGIGAAMIVMIGISYLDWPFATSIPTGRYLKWISLVFWSIVTAASFAFFTNVSLPRAGAPNHEFIFAVFALAASYLAFRLSFDIRRPVRIDRLVDIRRGFSLGQIALTEAVQATEIALVGMEGRTALEEHLRRTLALHRAFSEQAVRVNFLIHDAAAMLNEAKNASSAHEVRTELRAESIGKLNQADKAFKQAEELHAKIDRRMVWYEKASVLMRDEAPHSLFGGDGYQQLSAIQERVSQSNADAAKDLEMLRTSLSAARAAITTEVAE